MINKFKVGNENIFCKEDIEIYIDTKYNFDKDFNDKQLYKYWFSGNDNREIISNDLYLEVKRDLKDVFDYSILKRETCEVVDFICNEFDIHKDYVSIYFNGCNGFYIIINYIIQDNSENICFDKSINLLLKGAAEYIKLKTGIDSIRTDIYNLDSYHIQLQDKNKETGLYLINLTYEMLSDLNYKQLLNLASKEQDLKLEYEMDLDTIKVGEGFFKMVSDINEKYKNNFDVDKCNWYEGFKEFNECIRDCNIDEYYKEFGEIIEYSKTLYNRINLIPTQLDEEQINYHIETQKLDLITLLLKKTCLDKTGLSLYNYNKYDTRCVLAKVGLSPIFYLSMANTHIGNEKIFIDFYDGLKDYTFEKIVDIAYKVHKYITTECEI